MQKDSEEFLGLGLDEEEEEVDEPLVITPSGDCATTGNIAELTTGSLPLSSVSTMNTDTSSMLVGDDGDDGSSLNLAKNFMCSAEYLESVDAIAADPWDISSWMLYLEEVEQGRAGGVITVPVAYRRFLAQFPLSAMFWKKLIEHYIKVSEFALAREALNTCLDDCRNVDLWRLHLSLIKSSGKDTTFGCLEAEFERAVASVGYCMTSSPIWLDYLQLLRDTPVPDNNVLEAGKKVAALRSLLQRAVCVPADGMDVLWQEYEAFERMHSGGGGDGTGETALVEFNRRYLHAKSVYRERGRLTAEIEFDRLACPPAHSAAESRQLELWDQWIRFENGNPDNLAPAQLHSAVRLVYDQCLCCFRLHSEVWISLARLEMTQNYRAQSHSVIECRAVYWRAVACNPRSALLRLGLSELEEGPGDDPTAAETALREAFQQIPCGFTFALYQRFVRRIKGRLAARRLFSETAALRGGDEKLSLELFLAHARLEAEVNCDWSVALRALNLARERHPSCLRNVAYMRTITRVLRAIGDLQQIRWLFSLAVPDTSSSESGSLQCGSARGLEAARADMQLLDEHLRLEMAMNVADADALEALRGRRARNSSATERARATDSLFAPALELVERWDEGELSYMMIPESDKELRERVVENRAEQSGVRDSRGISRREAESIQNLSAEFQLSLAGLPLILRDLLNRLPLHNGPAPDLDLFLRQMKSVTLPPRPSVDEPSLFGDSSEDVGGASWLQDRLGEETDDAVDDSQQQLSAVSVLGRSRGLVGRDEEEDDPFRKRQRTKQLMQ